MTVTWPLAMLQVCVDYLIKHCYVLSYEMTMLEVLTKYMSGPSVFLVACGALQNDTSAPVSEASSPPQVPVRS